MEIKNENLEKVLNLSENNHSMVEAKNEGMESLNNVVNDAKGNILANEDARGTLLSLLPHVQAGSLQEAAGYTDDIRVKSTRFNCGHN